MTAALGFARAFLGVLTNPAALLLIAVAFTGGYFRGEGATEAKHKAASLQARIDALELDKATLEKAAAQHQAQAAEARAVAASNHSILEEIKRHASKTDPCVLSADDARRLRSIR
jgi:Tfp pilus assembly protein PilN